MVPAWRWIGAVVLLALGAAVVHWVTVQPRPRAFAPPPPACNRTFCNGTNARVAVAGLLFTADALPGLLTMGASLDAVACAAHCYDKVAVHTLPALPAHMRAFLAAYGWTARRVPLLDPGPGVGALRDKHAKSFTKLQLWSLVEYERVVFLDADVLVVAEVDALFSCVLPFCVAPDPPLALGMNTGVLVLAPSHTTYTHLMSKYAAIATAPEAGVTRPSYPYAEQDFLNELYPWPSLAPSQRLPNLYNMPANFFLFNAPDDFLPRTARIRILHYTAFKPWHWYTLPWASHNCRWHAFHRTLAPPPPPPPLRMPRHTRPLALGALLLPIVARCIAPHLTNPLRKALVALCLPPLSNALAFALLYALPLEYRLGWLGCAALTLAFAYACAAFLQPRPPAPPDRPGWHGCGQRAGPLAWPMLYLYLCDCSRHCRMALPMGLGALVVFDVHVAGVVLHLLHRGDGAAQHGTARQGGAGAVGSGSPPGPGGQPP